MVGLLSFPHYGHISFKTLGLKTVVRGGDLLFLLVDSFHMGVMENGTMMMDVSYVQDEAFHYVSLFWIIYIILYVYIIDMFCCFKPKMG
jgi:hypothetical protein